MSYMLMVFSDSCHNLKVIMEQFMGNIVKVKLATEVEGNQKAPFSIATTPSFRGGRYSFTLDTYLILLSVKQGGIKYHF